MNVYPKIGKNPDFYLQSLNEPYPSQWHSSQVVGQNTISEVVKTLMQDAGIKGFFTNHSARRTWGMRLFRASVQRKLVKEYTRHSSNAIDQFQIMSHQQRLMIPEVLAGQHVNQVKEVQAVKVDQNEPKDEEGAVKTGKNVMFVRIVRRQKVVLTPEM